MRRIYVFILLPILLSATTFLYANVSGTVIGLVKDKENDEPLEYVSVALYNSMDGNLVTGTISDTQGKFEIKGLIQGDYYLEVSFIGYNKTKVENINIDSRRTRIELQDIILPRSANELDEVEIVADELGVEYKIDRKVINVSQQLTAASGTAVDILENVPSITVDVDGNVALRGSTGFMLLIMALI